MRDDLDLCVKKRGHWSIYQIYPQANRKEALKDASYLKSLKDFDAVMLIDDADRRVIFSYVAKGKKGLSYRDIKKGLDDSSSKKMTASNGVIGSASKRPTTNPPPKQQTPSNKKVYVSLNIGLAGFLFSMMAMAVMVQSNAGGVLLTLMFLLLATMTILATFLAYSLFEAKTPEKKEATVQLKTQKNLQKTEEILTDVFVLGKSKVWDYENEKFKSDGYFALILYMLGMSQGFRNNLGTETDRTNAQIANLFATTGLDRESIISCGGNLPEYLVFPQYNALYQRGMSDVNKILGRPGYKIMLDDVLAPWATRSSHTPQPEQVLSSPDELSEVESPETQAEDFSAQEESIIPESNFALVMFTDIVGSTESIRHKGDNWMIDVLQAHNSIVREAITAFEGHEVKHTGDGIMMSFPSIERGVKASIAIQKGVSQFNQQMPHRAFPLRVGMSAGEPMRHEGDLFGLPVNLAARVLPYADAYEIAMSDECHSLCAELPFTFTSKKDCNFKGFDEPQTVYFLNWQNETTPSAEAEGVE